MKYRSYVVNERDVGSIGGATVTEYRTLNWFAESGRMDYKLLLCINY